MTAEQRELRLSDYLEHMIEASALACSYVEGMGLEAFRADKKTIPAMRENVQKLMTK